MGDGDPAGENQRKKWRVALDVGENSLAVCKELEGIQLEHVGTSK